MHQPPSADADAHIDSTKAPAASAAPVASAWAPLRRRVFCSLWIAGVVGNVGTWMHDVGAGWLMATMNPEPFWVSLVQAAGTLPILFLALPAGALADVIDRRRMILAVQSCVALLALALAFATFMGFASPFFLLLITLGLGVGAALTNPAWQTVMTELVPRDELPQASALNSVSLNLSRAVGPALGGIIVAASGPEAVFALRAVSLVGIIGVLLMWRYERQPSAAPGERFIGAVRAGIRYVRYSPPMHAVLVRTASFVIFATSLWALMPLIAKQQLGTGAGGYGIMLGCLGGGAVVTTFLLPKLRRLASLNALMVCATLIYTLALIAMAFADRPIVGYLIMVPIGAAWVTCVVCLNFSAQSGAPMWVRARALACYLATFFGSMAIGSPIWGFIAGKIGVPFTLLIAAVGLLLGLLTMIRYRLEVVRGEDLDRSSHWEDPVVAGEVGPDDGPVVITIEYDIPLESAEEFKAAMGPVATTRYRDGAISWLLSRDTEKPRRWLEVFIVESWAEHLRQHHRVTKGDLRIQARARAFHVGGKPIVAHHIAAPIEPRPAVDQPQDSM